MGILKHGFSRTYRIFDTSLYFSFVLFDILEFSPFVLVDNPFTLLNYIVIHFKCLTRHLSSVSVGKTDSRSSVILDVTRYRQKIYLSLCFVKSCRNRDVVPSPPNSPSSNHLINIVQTIVRLFGFLRVSVGREPHSGLVNRIFLFYIFTRWSSGSVPVCRNKPFQT